MVIARGVDGEVGILAGHAPMLVQLAVGPLRIQQAEGAELRAVVDGGFLHVTSGAEGTRVDVLASHAELESEIDVERAAREQRELEARDDDEAELALAKARARTEPARLTPARGFVTRRHRRTSRPGAGCGYHGGSWIDSSSPEERAWPAPSGSPAPRTPRSS